LVIDFLLYRCLWLLFLLTIFSHYLVQMSSLAHLQASLTLQPSPLMTLMSIHVPGSCHLILLLLDYLPFGSLGSSYLMMRKHIDCSSVTNLISLMQRKLDRNHGELALDKSVPVYSLPAVVSDKRVIVTYFIHKYLASIRAASTPCASRTSMVYAPLYPFPSV
jgi:hypothetical protein